VREPGTQLRVEARSIGSAEFPRERGRGGVCWFHKHARSLAGWLFTLAGREPGGGEGRASTFVSMKGVVDCGKGETARKGKAVA
jgi:hypothetical protein